MRNTNAALTSGGIEPVNLNDDGLLAYNRTFAGAALLVIHNLTGKSKTVELKSLNQKYLRLIYSSKFDSEYDGVSINLAPYQSVVLQ